jgi:hypothetical protein
MDLDLHTGIEQLVASSSVMYWCKLQQIKRDSRNQVYLFVCSQRRRQQTVPKERMKIRTQLFMSALGQL